MRESITIKKTKDRFYKRFDDYEDSFHRIPRKEAEQSIESARNKGVMFSDNDISKEIAVWGYWN